MNRAERRKAGERGSEKRKTYTFHSLEEIHQFVFRGPGQEAAKAEVERIILKEVDRIELDCDAATLWALHVSCGFGKQRLERFYCDFHRIWREMRDRYVDDDAYAELLKLKEMGVDVEKLKKECEENALL